MTAAAGLVLLAAACSAGSGGSPDAGGAANSAPAAGTGSGGGARTTGLLAYASCMRSHGVPNFPDPASSGGIPKGAVISAEGEVSNAQFQAAQNTCYRLMPGGSLSGQVSQTISTQQQQYYLKAAACMRAHGITNFPEPSFSDSRVEFPMLQHIVDINSPQFTRAYQICQKLIPLGLPDSGSGG
jgi:hypothetical protein